MDEVISALITNISGAALTPILASLILLIILLQTDRVRLTRGMKRMEQRNDEILDLNRKDFSQMVASLNDLKEAVYDLKGCLERLDRERLDREKTIGPNNQRTYPRSQRFSNQDQ